MASKNDEVQPVLTWFQQSPVELEPALRARKLGKPIFHYSKAVTGTFSDDNFVVTHPGRAWLQYRGLRCPLLKIHFHGPAEHAIAGQHPALEAHLIHAVPSIHEVAPAELLVVGVFFDPQPPSQKTSVQPTFKTWTDVLASRYFQPKNGQVSVVPDTFLPPNRTDFYRYEGSLTTSPYTENVSWLVLRDHALLNTAIEQLVKQETEHPPRAIQPRERRFVLRNF